MADGLDRSHYQNVKDLEVVTGKETIKINIWTEGEPYLEIWGASRKSELLKEMTGKSIQIERVIEAGVSN